MFKNLTHFTVFPMKCVFCETHHKITPFSQAIASICDAVRHIFGTTQNYKVAQKSILRANDAEFKVVCQKTVARRLCFAFFYL